MMVATGGLRAEGGRGIVGTAESGANREDGNDGKRGTM